MKRLSLLLLPFLAISLASCDGISPEAKNAFVGEYWMETTYDIKNGNEVVDSSYRTKWSTVYIYEEDGKLFVHTNWFGAPYLSNDNEHARVLEESYERPEYISLRRMPSEDSEGIEDVEPATGGPIVFMRNGYIYTIRTSEYIMSEPIAVKSGSSKVLELKDSESFTIALTDPDGVMLANVVAAFKYGSIAKSTDDMSWQVDLSIDGLSGQGSFDRIVYKNKLYKK